MRKRLLTFTAVILALNASFGQISTAKQSLYFEIGKTDISDDHKAQLDSVLFFVQSTDDFKIGIKGYTCSIGTPEVNRKISNQRALNVYNYLTQNGIKKDSVFYAGLGMKDPMGDNTTEEGRRRNRRTDLEITFKYTPKVETKTQPVVKAPEAPAPPAQVAKFGPDAVTINFKKEAINIIESTNCISVEIPENAFNTPGNELLEMNIKDLTKNYDLIKKSVHTFSGKQYLAMLGAIQVDVTQGTESVLLKEDKSIKVNIPGEYDPNIKLYRNSRNWQEDTINKMTYNYSKQAYEIKMSVLGELVSLAKVIDTAKLLLIKIKAGDKTKIKPYVIHSNCMITAGKHVKKKWYALPYIGATGMVRGFYQDFSSSTPKTFVLKEDISYTENNVSGKAIMGISFLKLSNPSTIEYKFGEMDKGNLCEMPCTK